MKKLMNEKVVATLELVVEYEDLPTGEELEDLIDKARELGGVSKAALTIHKRIVKNLV